jgi:hypothetical protein
LEQATGPAVQHPDEEFTNPHLVSLSPAALEFGREFAAAWARRDGPWITAYDWATSLVMQKGPDAPQQEVGPCMLLSGYKRAEVPPKMIRSFGEFDFVVKIPAAVLGASAQRLIDIDPALPFKLVLR